MSLSLQLGWAISCIQQLLAQLQPLEPSHTSSGVAPWSVALGSKHNAWPHNLRTILLPSQTKRRKNNVSICCYGSCGRTWAVRRCSWAKIPCEETLRWQRDTDWDALGASPCPHSPQPSRCAEAVVFRQASAPCSAWAARSHLAGRQRRGDGAAKNSISSRCFSRLFLILRFDKVDWLLTKNNWSRQAEDKKQSIYNHLWLTYICHWSVASALCKLVINKAEIGVKNECTLPLWFSQSEYVYFCIYPCRLPCVLHDVIWFASEKKTAVILS